MVKCFVCGKQTSLPIYCCFRQARSQSVCSDCHHFHLKHDKNDKERIEYMDPMAEFRPMTEEEMKAIERYIDISMHVRK